MNNFCSCFHNLLGGLETSKLNSNMSHISFYYVIIIVFRNMNIVIGMINWKLGQSYCNCFVIAQCVLLILANLEMGEDLNRNKYFYAVSIFFLICFK